MTELKSGTGHRANDDRLLDRNTGYTDNVMRALRDGHEPEPEAVDEDTVEQFTAYARARQRGFHDGDNGADPERLPRAA